METLKEIAESAEFTEIYNTLCESEPYKSDNKSRKDLFETFLKATIANPKFEENGKKLAKLYELHLQNKSENKN